MRKSTSVQKVPYLAPDVITKAIPAPVDGWDAISPLAEMDPKRAPILTNWVPRPGYVELRGGFNRWSNTMQTSAVESLMVYRSPTEELMFAAVGSDIFDVSISVAGAPVVTTKSSARWQYVNFTPQGGTTHLQAVNGLDDLIMFDGTTWTVPSITGLPGTTADIVNINAQKARLWYVLKDSTIAAFMPTGAIIGPIDGTQDLGALWTKGGHMVAMASWTVDGGAGPSDYAVFISSKGQLSIYTGTDPTNAAAWSLVGTFDVSPPIGRRCFTRVGSDVLLITQQGVIPISQALPFDPSADRSVAVTARIQNAMSQAAINGPNLFGWEVISFPAQQLLVLNVPITENQLQVQYVMNTLTGAWCQFNGWNANTFAIYQDNLYWGGNNGIVNQGYTGGFDYTDPIAADMQCAFNWFDEPGKLKRMTLVEPLLTLGSGIIPTLGVDVDFNTTGQQAIVTFFASTVLWDVALWDVSMWPTLSINFTSWLSVDAIGHALAIRMQVNIAPLPVGLLDFAFFDVANFSGVFDPNLPILRVNAFNSVLEMGGAI